MHDSLTTDSKQRSSFRKKEKMSRFGIFKRMNRTSSRCYLLKSVLLLSRIHQKIPWKNSSETVCGMSLPRDIIFQQT